MPKKKRTKTLPSVKAKEEFPSTYTRPMIYWKHSSGGLYSEGDFHHYEKTGVFKIGDGVQICSRCKAPVVDNKHTCKCLIHVCGSVFKAVSPGACKNPIHCDVCCRCVTCSKCKRLFKTIKGVFYRNVESKICTGCGLCNECCKCVMCVNCQQKLPTKYICLCGDKQRRHHADCCDADAKIDQYGKRLMFIKREPVFYEGSNFQHNRCRRFLSIESEVDHLQGAASAIISLNKWARKWGCAVVQEGTVPNGGEICTSPASGDKYEDLIVSLLEEYKNAKPSINVRCGMHVHVDARDFTYMDLINLLYLYNKIEPAIFAMLPPWRRINRFTTPCRSQLLRIAKQGNKMVEVVKDLELYNITRKPMATVKKPAIALKLAEQLYGKKTLMNPKRVHKTNDNQRVRYMALNPHSWIYRRTFEFRHWPGTVDQEEMLLWPQICGAILDTAKKMPITAKRGSPCINRLPSDPVEALLHILKPKSWISGQLLSFVERKLNKWSPDWEHVWPLIQENEDDWAVPLPKKSKDLCLIGFDIQNQLFTYIRPDYLDWNHQWIAPIGAGRYATVRDLTSIPRGKLMWIRNEIEEEPAKPIKHKPKFDFDDNLEIVAPIYERIAE